MLAKQYRLMWQFMRRRVNKLWVITMLACFAFGVICAFGVGFLDSESYQTLSDGLYAPSPDEDMLSSWYGLWAHNIVADAVNVLLGFIPFVPLPAFDLALNDGSLGAMCAMSGNAWGVSPWLMLLAYVVPHGVVEFPINTLAGVLGLIIWWDVTRKIVGSNTESLSTTFKQCARVFVLVIIPGLLIAGLLESYLTPWIVSQVGW